MHFLRPSVLLAISVLLLLPNASSQLQSPGLFLGHDLGTSFTLHHRVDDYAQHIHDAVPQSELINYGETSEGRPLQLLILSSSENLGKLEAIRSQHLDRMNGGHGDKAFDDVAIVWLSYNVHGNEAVCTEAALKVMHQAATSSLTNDGMLDRVILIIDPCLNPDGHDRYASWFNRYASKTPNPNPDAFEHDEPWPGGRSNHYLFDLNRDWAWQKQKESKERSVVYHQWMPHVHCDFHEMGYNSPYYFAPAAEPYHESITDWQREFQVEVGKTTAAAFDKRGELYYTKESFDLLYPSYGDTYPIYNGAIGMTYEQGGSGSAGVLIETNNGELLSLSNRIENHVESSLKAIETSARLSEKLVDEWSNFHERNRTQPIGRFGGYLISVNETNQARADRLAEFLHGHGIQVEKITQNKKPIKGWEYGIRSERSVVPKSGDLIISSFQTHSGLLDVLFDPDPVLTDSLTYDITTWSVPYAYGLRTFGLSKPLMGESWTSTSIEALTDVSAYGYAFRRHGDGDSKLFTQLLQNGVRLRTNSEPFVLDGIHYERGTTLILRGDQEIGSDWESELFQGAVDAGVELQPLSGGFADSGPDMGSDDIWFVKAPRVAALTGPGVSSLGAGEVWWHFEEELSYPISMLSAEDSDPGDWDSYDVVIMPSGWYGRSDADWMESASTWVREGGKIIALAGALRFFESENGWGLDAYSDVSKEKIADQRSREERQSDRKAAFSERNRRRAMGIGDGSIYPVKLDITHPLAWGYSNERYYTLRSNDDRYALLSSGWSVGMIEDGAEAISGFVGARANRDLEDSMVFGVQPMGRGSIIYLSDNPLFRGFWENGKLLFDNAVFLPMN